LTTYRERLKAGHHDASKQQPEPDLDPDNLPSRHAALDELATARGVIWSSDFLSVADKQAQLKASF
jgi:hypothetical protein